MRQEKGRIPEYPKAYGEITLVFCDSIFPPAGAFAGCPVQEERHVKEEELIDCSGSVIERKAKKCRIW